MATGRLTWQNVAAPDFSGAVAAQRASALAFDSAMERLSGAVETFDNNRKDRADAAVMMNAMKYQNADDLQAAIASGALTQGVNPDHVRVGALLKAQAQAGQLMALERDRQAIATFKQTFDFNELRNPQLIEEGRLKNAAAQQTFDHDAQNQPITLATKQAALEAQLLTTATEWNKYNRGEESHQANRYAAAEYNKLVNSGLIHDPAAMAQFRTTLDPRDPGHAALLSKIDTQFKDSITPISAPGSYTGAPLSAPQSGIQPVSGVPGLNSPEAGAFYANAVQNNPLLPTFLKGLGKLETGPNNKSTIGNNNFFNIKDVANKGPRRFDKVEGSNDSYREFTTPEEAYAEVTTLLGRKYPAALTARTPEEFANALSNGVGGAKYATDPKHANKVASVINQELKKAGGTPPPVATAPSTAPTAPAVASTEAAATPTPTTAAQMGIPQATNAAAPAQNAPTPAPSTPTADAPAANQLSPENAAIAARVTQQTLGLGQSAGNTAELSSFAAAAADKKTTFEEAGKSIVDAFPGLDRRDVDNMLTQVQAMHPMLRSPAAAAFVIKNTPKTSAWYDPFNWGDNIRIDKDAVEAKVAEWTTPDAVRTGVLTNEVSANIGAKVAEADKNLTATNDIILALNEQLRNAAPGSARANALQSEITRMEGKAAKYRDQIDTREAQEKSLTEEIMRAANPELYAKQKKEAEQRRAAAAAVDAAMTKKTAPPTTEPAQKEAAAITVDVIRNMTPTQLKELRESPEFFRLTGQRWDAFNIRKAELESGR